MEREDIAKELTGLPRVVEVIAKKVDDERQQQEIAAAAEKQAGRSTGPVDRHAQHAQGPEAVDRPVDRNSLTGSAQLSVVFGRPTGRPRWRSVDQPVDRQSGLGSAVTEIWVFKAVVNFLGLCACEKDFAGNLLHSKRLLAIVNIFLVINLSIGAP